MFARFTALLALAAAVILAATANSARAADELWTENVAEAMETAVTEEKDLLMDFTGSDWCGWCIRLKNEVFSKDHFKSEAPKHFVLVELDFPRDKSKLSEATIKQNEEWRQKLNIRGYPTIVLADEQGRPYATTGYRPGGPQDYVDHLAELRARRTARDEAMQQAEKAQGTEKAKHLDKAMEAVGDDLALDFYSDVVEQIVELDADNEAGLKEKYASKLNNQKAQTQMREALMLARAQKLDEAIEKIDQILAEYTPTGETKMQLLAVKAQLYVGKGDKETAMKLLDEAIAISPDSRMGKGIAEFRKTLGE